MRSNDIAVFERSHSRFVSLTGRSFSVHEAEIERGRIGGAEGERVFSGPPPTEWCGHLNSPLQSASSGYVSEVLHGIVEPWGESASICHSTLTSCRVTIANDDHVHQRNQSVWAMTGWLAIDSKRRVPIGWSGRGDGLPWLRVNAHRELAELYDGVSRAARLQPGCYSAVCSPAAAAVLLHETIGHFAEAPFAPGINAIHRLSCRIATERLSVLDDPRRLDGPVDYEYDDEMVRSGGPTTLVHEGILVAQLHSQASARAARTLPTSNGRTACAWDLPIPRMSNLICQPGSSSEEQLVADVDDGLYISRLSDGTSNGLRVGARIVLAQRIRAGVRVQEFFTGARIDETAKVLREILDVADNPTFNTNSMCGRGGQLLFDVGTSAPSLRLGAIWIT
jgi:TldD protein